MVALRASLALLLFDDVLAATLNRRQSPNVIFVSYKDATNGASFGTLNGVTTINPGVTVWLSGDDPHNLRGNINVYGELILSETDYTGNRGGMDSDYTGTNTQNGNLFIASGGVISLNDWQAANDAAYIWHLYTFTNNGTLQWCGLGNAGSGSDYSLHCEVNCYNYGIIDWGQYDGYLPDTAVEWENDNKQPPGQSTYNNLYNFGTFRLTNTVFRGRQNILGDGCWVLGVHGILYLEDGAGYYQNPTSGPTYPAQNIYFSQNTAVLHLDSQTYTINPNFGPQLYGFGTGHAIEFEETIRSYTYNTATGILTVILSTANHPLYLKLGLGYVQSGFSTRNNPTSYSATGFNAIFYAQPAPLQVIPTRCQASALATCTDPSATARQFGYSTSSTSTSQVPTFVTTSAQYTGTGIITVPTTTTIPPSGTAPGTIVIYTPASYVTTSQQYTGTVPSTSTVLPTGTAPGTVVIYTPAPYVTSTAVYTGPGTIAAASTSTIAPSGTAPGTVVIYTPATYLTSTPLYTGSATLTAASTSTIPPSGTSPGVIVIYTPPSYITSTASYTGTGTLTSTIAPSGTAPGTVVIYTPVAYSTSTEVYTGPGVITAQSTSTVPPSGTVPGYVVIYTPASYVTTSQPYTGAGQITSPFTATVAPSGTTPGTVIIYTPPATSSPTSTRPATVTTAIGPNSCFCTAV